MENIFYQWLNPRGTQYAKKMRLYKSLKKMNLEEIVDFLKDNLTDRQRNELLANYIMCEVKQENVVEKIKITSQQLEKFFEVTQFTLFEENKPFVPQFSKSMQNLNIDETDEEMKTRLNNNINLAEERLRLAQEELNNVELSELQREILLRKISRIEITIAKHKLNLSKIKSGND